MKRIILISIIIFCNINVYSYNKKDYYIYIKSVITKDYIFEKTYIYSCFSPMVKRQGVKFYSI